MEDLIDSRYLPITFSAGFLEAELPSVIAENYKWERSLGWDTTMTEFAEASLDTLTSLFPLTMPDQRALFLMTRSSWTVCFDNGEMGTDAESLVSYLSHVIGCRGLTVTCIPREFTLDIPGAKVRPRGFYAAIQFTLYDPAVAPFPNCARAISLIEDSGKWEFDTVGTPLEFEDIDVYKARYVRARFSPQLLGDYCRHLGISLFEQDFYRGRAVMEQVDKRKAIDEKTILSLFSLKKKPQSGSS